VVAAAAAQSLAYGGSLHAKPWAAHLLTLHARVSDSHALAVSVQPLRVHQLFLPYELCLLQRGLAMLTLEAGKSDDRSISTPIASEAKHTQTEVVVRWLAGLRAGLLWSHMRLKQAQQAARLSIAPQHPGPAVTAQDLHPLAGLLLGRALLQQDIAVVAAAMSVVDALLTVQPQAGLPLLPLLLLCFRQHLSSAAVRSSAQAYQHFKHRYPNPDQQLLQGLLNVCGRMMANTAAAPFITRVLQPLQAPNAPLPVQCWALRALVQAWLLTGVRV
jgi:hypothetical protein